MEQTLSSQLESSVTSYYLQLSDGYVKMHLERMNSINSMSSGTSGKQQMDAHDTSRPVSTNLYVENPFPSSLSMKKDRYIHNVNIRIANTNINLSRILIRLSSLGWSRRFAEEKQEEDSPVASDPDSEQQQQSSRL